MANRYSPEKKSIGTLLSMTNPPIVVPDWQRNYSWTTSEVETFWQDLILFDESYPGDNVLEQEYFLGSIVIVDNNVSHLLLDGQQRLATSAILISVVRDFLGRNNPQAATRVSTRYLTDFDDAQNRNTFKLTLNQYDRDFFRREVLENRNVEYVAPEPTMESHRQVRAARGFFVEKFTRKYEVTSAEIAHQWALRILKVLTQHVSVVAVISEDEDNAATVFETLNDRGIGLSTPDLLRNLILRRADEDRREEIIDLWRIILEIEGDTNLRTFLRHYWLSHEGDVKTQSLYKEMKAKIVTENLDPLLFSRALRDSSEVYRNIVAAQDDDEELSSLLSDVNSLGATVLYPLIMSAFGVGDVPQIKSLLRALITTFVRHNVICSLENSRLEDIVFSSAKELRRDRNFEAIIERMRGFAPMDERFTSACATASVSRRASARYLLKELELALRRTEEIDVAPPNRVHVEHIYPQTPREGLRWANHALMINRLGNLTLLSRKLNTAIKNSDFAVKRPVYEQSELRLTRQVLSYDQWGPDEIDARQAELTTLAVNIWRF